MNTNRAMKLQDCSCGGIPQVTYNINDNLEFSVVCETCGNQTPVCESLREAVVIWNKTYCRALNPYEIASA